MGSSPGRNPSVQPVTGVTARIRRGQYERSEGREPLLLHRLLPECAHGAQNALMDRSGETPVELALRQAVARRNHRVFQQ